MSLACVAAAPSVQPDATCSRVTLFDAAGCEGTPVGRFTIDPQIVRCVRGQALTRALGQCIDDKARSVLLENVPTGQRVVLFDDARGRRAQRVTIVTHADVSRACVADLDRSQRHDEYALERFGTAGLSGAVSRVHINRN